jgi:hypothetical protein
MYSGASKNVPVLGSGDAARAGWPYRSLRSQGHLTERLPLNWNRSFFG